MADGHDAINFPKIIRSIFYGHFGRFFSKLEVEVEIAQDEPKLSPLASFSTKSAKRGIWLAQEMGLGLIRGG